MYQVRELAKIAERTPRTIHYNDDIGLLSSEKIGRNGYRHYGRSSLLRLQQILFFKRFGYKLKEIKLILDDKDFSLAESLENHREKIIKEIETLKSLLDTIDKTIASEKGDIDMSDEVLFENLSHNETKLAEEALEQWNPETVKESYRGYNRLSAAVYTGWAKLIGTDPASQQAQEMVKRWGESIEFFWSPDDAGLLGLAEMYGSDQRFRKFYEAIHPGLAEFILACVKIYCST